MNIVWLSWKDIHHPLAGGAESVSFELMKRLVANGHSVKLVTAAYENSMLDETIDGIDIHREGNRFSVYTKAARYFSKNNLENWADITIDEMNTIPFFSPLYSHKAKNILFVHQLAREVWFYQMIFPLSLVGYFLEPLYLKFISKKMDGTLTVSNSTKSDLQRHGFSNVSVISVGMELKPLEQLPRSEGDPYNILILGAMRPMKRTLDGVKAFEYAYASNDNLRLTLVGDDSTPYGKKVIEYINKSPIRKSVYVLGRVSYKTKLEEMRKSNIILVTSVKEGWGLIVTEANSQGTVAIGYNVDGLRDSIVDYKTGRLSEDNSPKSLGDTLIEVTQNPDELYQMRERAWQYSKEFSYDNSYEKFIHEITKIINSKKH